MVIYKPNAKVYSSGMKTPITVYFDGACEPINPGGTAAYGVVIVKGEEELFRESKVFIPQKGKEKETSNNVAEYSGFLKALQWLYENGYKDEEILVRGDSQLVIYQNWIDPRYNHKWRVRRGLYIPICREAQKILKLFSNISGEWIPREENNLADELSKAEILKAGVVFRIQPNK